MGITRVTERLMLFKMIAYALIFVALSADIMVRIWDWRWKFESPLDVVALLFFEGIRSVVTLGGIAATVLCAARVRRHPALLRLALATIFATIAYTKMIAFRGFPGAVQERVAQALLAADVPVWVLQVVFAQPAWAAWLALGALVLFARSYPRPLQSQDVQEGGVSDRTGALRSVALAGTDIGHAARVLTSRALAGPWLSARRVWLLAGTAAAAHTVLDLTLSGTAATVVHGAGAIGAALGITLVVTLTRTAWVVEPERRTVLRWLRRGALTALVLLACSALAALVGLTAVAVALLSLGPAAVAAAIAAAALSVPPGAASTGADVVGVGAVPGGSAGGVPVSDPIDDD